MSLKSVRENRCGFIRSRISIFPAPEDHHPFVAAAMACLREILSEASEEEIGGEDPHFLIKGYCEAFDPLPLGSRAPEYEGIFHVMDNVVSAKFRRPRAFDLIGITPAFR